MVQSSRCLVAAVFASLLAVVFGGCVTEEVRPRERGVAVVPPSRTGQPAADLGQFDGSFRPAHGARTQRSRVNVAVQPLGPIPYDGMTLPAVSPDGRFVATRTGQAPSWADVLGVPVGGEVPGVSPPGEIRLYRVVESDASRRRVATIEHVRGRQPLPDDLLLGRSASNEGVLVEQQLETGARRIGVVLWGSGAVRWLVDDGAVNALATWTADGGLAWMRKSLGDNSPAEVGVLLADQVSSVLRTGVAIGPGAWGSDALSGVVERVTFGGDAVIAIPVAPADAGFLGVLVVDGRGNMAWQALSRTADARGGLGGRGGWVGRASRRVASGTGVMHAYQAVASTATPVWMSSSVGVAGGGVGGQRGAGSGSGDVADGVLTSVSFVHPGFSDVAVLDLLSGEIRRLGGEVGADALSVAASAGVAATPATGSGADDGWLVTSEKGLSIRWATGGDEQGGVRSVGSGGFAGVQPPVEVISWGGLARATPFGVSEFLLIGPSPRTDGWWMFVQRLGFVSGE